MTTTKPPARHLRIFGIEVHVHWTFVLLLGWFFAAQLVGGQGVSRALRGVVFTATVFACVVLHELGHALTARRFGIQTRNIVLYPIGGVAQLERLPERPREELLVAIAGPLVSFMIAGGLLVFVDLPSAKELSTLAGSFLGHIAYVNLSLGMFNLLPALPMDGGRILHAALAWRIGPARATNIAAHIGKALALLMGSTGFISGQWMLMLIGGFVFFSADREASALRTHALLQGVSVRDAMLQQFDIIDARTTAADAARALRDSDQDAFPVLLEGAVVGVVRRAELVAELAAGGDTTPMATLARPAQNVLDSMPLEDALQPLQSAAAECLPVLRAGVLVGLLTAAHLQKWLILREVVESKAQPLRSPRRA